MIFVCVYGAFLDIFDPILVLHFQILQNVSPACTDTPHVSDQAISYPLIYGPKAPKMSIYCMSNTLYGLPDNMW